MFHTGDLNSGISLAIQQQKLVACLIRDDDAVSQQWEDEWLKSRNADDSTTFGERLGTKAVMLRLDYGGKEAGFLSAFCVIEKAPTLVIIDKGRVLEKLEGGTEEEEWVQRVETAVGLSAVAEGKNVEEDAGVGASTLSPATSHEATESHTAPQVEQAPTSQPAVPNPSSSSQTIPSTLFPSRAAQHAASKAKLDAAAAAAREARQTARRKEAEEAHSAHNDKGKGKAPATDQDDESAKQQRAARTTYLHQQSQLKADSKRERERILAQIEADKSERRLRAQRAATANSGAGGGEAESSPLPSSRIAATRRSAGAGGLCALQIRLFDGSSVRAQFPSTSTLGVHVREWVKETSPSSAEVPYSFRQILAPRPSRSIEVGEEQTSLEALGLVPNATLVLVPVGGAMTDAYASSGTAAGGVLGYASSLVRNVGYYLPSASKLVERLYMGGTGEQSEGSNVAGARMAGATAGDAERVGGKGKAKEKEKKDPPREFYNGNSLGLDARRRSSEGDGEAEAQESARR